MSKFLELSGLTRYDGKIKDYIKDLANGASFAVARGHLHNANGNTLSSWSDISNMEDNYINLKYNNSTTISKANVEAYVQLMFGEKRIPIYGSAAGRNLFLLIVDPVSGSEFSNGDVVRVEITASGSNYTMILRRLTRLATISDLYNKLEGATRYVHNIRLYNSSSNAMITFSLVTNSSTALTYNTLPYALYSAGFNSSTKTCPASGAVMSSTSANMVVGVYGTSSTTSSTTLAYRYLTLFSRTSSSATTATLAGSLSSNTNSFTLSSSWTIEDTVQRTVRDPYTY